MNLYLILLFLFLHFSPITSNLKDRYDFDASILDDDQDVLISKEDLSEDVDPEEDINKEVLIIPRSEKIPVTNSLTKISRRCIELINSQTFVDKTQFLEALLESRRQTQMNVITSPHGFGKTTLLDLIKFFVQTEVDPKTGTPLKIEKMMSFSVFANKSSNLHVSRTLSFIYGHLGHRPVIYLNLKKIIGKTIKSTWKNLQSRIKKLFNEYAWMVNKIKHKYQTKRYDCTVNEKLQYAVMDKIMTNQKVNAATFEMCLFIFSEALYMHFKRRVVVLIDDFDDPLIEMATHPQDDFPREKVALVLGNMLDRLLVGIDKLKYVDVALLTGTTHVRLSITFQSYAKLFKFNRFLDGHPFASYFGFTETEVKDLFKKHNLDEKDLDEVRELHNGYVTVNERNPTILYCPQSVISFLNQKLDSDNQPFLPLVNNPSLTKFVRVLRHDQIRSMISQLLVSQPVVFALARRMEYEDLEHLGKFLNDEVPDRDGNVVQTFFTFLLDQGYLTNAQYPKAKTTVFQVTNKESLQGLAGFFYEYFVNYENLDLNSIAVLFNNIYTSDEVSEQMLIELKKTLRNLYPDEENPDINEYRMHTLIYCTLLKNYLNDTIEVKINSDPDMETDTEIRADIFFSNRDRSRAMIIEIRQDITAKQALQLAVKSLNKWKTERKLKIIKYIGISFNDGEKVRVGYKDNVHDTPIIAKKSPRRSREK
ncbi:uncharacterized protein LOC135848687 [Planococcus citri]|uniref:uncharacterized protein LOC135848687 n=1 Tax=Planococcus citri TaxID=170843 RepID=UPI0031F80927